MDDLDATRHLLSRQLADAIAIDPVRALRAIVAVQRDADDQLREAVRQAALRTSWREIAAELGVSKQAAHQRFKVYAKGVAAEIKTEHRAMKHARRVGDAARAGQAQYRRDEMIAQLRSAATDLKRSH